MELRKVAKAIYSKENDITFVMEETYDGEELKMERLVSFFHGEPTKELVEQALKSTSLIAYFD